MNNHRITVYLYKKQKLAEKVLTSQKERDIIIKLSDTRAKKKPEKKGESEVKAVKIRLMFKNS